MPKFTLTKHGDNSFDSDVTMEFYTETLDLARAHYDDFLKAAGFELPMEDKEDEHEYVVSDPEDWLWDDAFASKFQDFVHAAEPVKMDGILGNAGADIIQFPTPDQT